MRRTLRRTLRNVYVLFPGSSETYVWPFEMISYSMSLAQLKIKLGIKSIGLHVLEDEPGKGNQKKYQLLTSFSATCDVCQNVYLLIQNLA